MILISLSSLTGVKSLGPTTKCHHVSAVKVITCFPRKVNKSDESNRSIQEPRAHPLIESLIWYLFRSMEECVLVFFKIDFFFFFAWSLLNETQAFDMWLVLLKKKSASIPFQPLPQ